MSVHVYVQTHTHSHTHTEGRGIHIAALHSEILAGHNTHAALPQLEEVVVGTSSPGFYSLSGSCRGDMVYTDPRVQYF